MLRKPEPPPGSGQYTAALAALQARVDQVVALLDDTLRGHRTRTVVSTTELVDLALDVRHLLAPGRGT